MKRFLMILAVLLLIAPVTVQAGHIALDLSGVWVRSTDPSTPPNQLNVQVGLMYNAIGGLWLGGQASSDEGATATGGLKAVQMLPVGLKNDKGHEWLSLGVSGWYDFNEKALDLSQATAGLVFKITPAPDSKLGIQVGLMAEGYEDILTELVRAAGGDESVDGTPPEPVLVVTEENGTAFVLTFGAFWNLD